VLLFAPAIGFMLLVSALVAVGLVSWNRTRSIRRGAIPFPDDTPKSSSFRSSRTTLLAGLAGMSAIAWGVATAGRGVRIEALLLVASGTFIAIAGSVARVTEMLAGDEGLHVHFAARSPFRARWGEIHELRSPRTPVGGWRLAAADGTRTTLMPSDLFGHEELLAEVVARSGLSFDGRRWVRDGEREAIQ
jgi:hypothetical protein